MKALTGQLAAVLASTDAVPRLVRKSTTLFLVTPKGDVWRIFDSDDVRGKTRFAPAEDHEACSRVFVGSGLQPVVRVYRFSDGEAQSVNAEKLLHQLEAARAVD